MAFIFKPTADVEYNNNNMKGLQIYYINGFMIAIVISLYGLSVFAYGKSWRDREKESKISGSFRHYNTLVVLRDQNENALTLKVISAAKVMIELHWCFIIDFGCLNYFSAYMLYSLSEV